VFVCILPGKAVPEMTYTVSGWTLNATHSLTGVGESATFLSDLSAPLCWVAGVIPCGR